MTTKVYWVYFPVAITTFIGGYLAYASPCDGSPENLHVDFTPQRIFSPGYPDLYDNNLRCEWVFETIVNTRTGFGIQLTTLELQLDAPHSLKTGHCNDSLEAFEGTPSTLGHSLGKWCGRAKHVLKTMSNRVTLRFITNDYYVGRGFVIEYSLVRVASAECQPGKVTPVHVGRAPLYESFHVKNTESRCSWTMEAIDESGYSDPESALVIEAFSVPYVLCHVGHFIVYDGQDSSSRKVFEWCDRGHAFSKIYLSSNYATLTFHSNLDKNTTLSVDVIQLKLYSRNSLYACNSTHMPSINIGMDPVYFSLPFAWSPSGSICDVHVTQYVKNTVRIEVLNVDGQESTCDTEAVSVRTASADVDVVKLCNRRRYPMYLPQAHSLIVGIRNGTQRVYIRAITDDHYCGGWDFQAIAYDSIIREEKLPKESYLTTVPHNCYHRHVIKTEHKNRVVSLRILWSPNVFQNKSVFPDSDACSGDFVSVYDGTNESAPLLFSSCRKSDMMYGYVDARIVGTKEVMLVLFNTDGVNEARHVTIQFFAAPLNIREYENIQMILVNRSAQSLTSPNYPDFYPLEYTWTYVLTAGEDDVIVIVPEDTRFTAGCGDILNIYEAPIRIRGSKSSSLVLEGASLTPERILDRICGHDRTDRKIVSRTHKVVMRFSSDKSGSTGGWKLRLYSRHILSRGYKSDVCLVLILLALFHNVVSQL